MQRVSFGASKESDSSVSLTGRTGQDRTGQDRTGQDSEIGTEGKEIRDHGNAVPNNLQSISLPMTQG
jgi:hypothetical protein